MEQGGVIISGLLRTAAWLALFSALAFDTGAVLINRVLLDEAARTAAVQAAHSWRTFRHPEPAWQAAEQSLADQQGVELLDVAVADQQAVVTVRRRATVLLADRLPPLEALVRPRVIARAPLDALARR